VVVVPVKTLHYTFDVHMIFAVSVREDYLPVNCTWSFFKKKSSTDKTLESSTLLTFSINFI